MKTLKYKLIKIAAVMFALLTVLSVGVSAAVPYDSYTHWSDVGTERKDVYNRPMYEPLKAFDAADIGVEAFKEIKSISVDRDGLIYILDFDHILPKPLPEMPDLSPQQYPESPGSPLRTDRFPPFLYSGCRRPPLRRGRFRQ